MNPNTAFRLKKRKKKWTSVELNVVRIQCACDYRITITRKTWLSHHLISCPICGRTDEWEVT